MVCVLKASIPLWYRKRTKFTELGSTNGKWQFSFNEITWLIFAQNLGQIDHAFNKMLGKLYLLPAFSSKCYFIFAFWGHTFAVLMPFRLSSVRKCLSSGHFVCLHLATQCFYIAKFPRFSNFNLFFRKTVNFGLFVLCLIENGKTRKMVNLQNGIWIL